MRVLMTAGLLCASVAAAQPTPGSGAIEGQVVNWLTGAPVRRAMVALTSDQIRLTAETDGEGKFEFTGLPAGSYRLTASRPGFLERRAPRLIAVGATERVANAAIRLAPQGVIAGRVLDEAGEAADRARVSAMKQVYRNGRRGWEQVGVAQSNERGEYRFANLKPGRHILLAYNERPTVNNRYDRPPNSFYVSVYHPNATTED